MTNSQNQWQFITENNKSNASKRICNVCGADYKKKAILDTENGYICSSCLLNASNETLQQHPLSGNYNFIYGEISMKEYDQMIDNAEEDLALEFEEEI